MTFRNWSDEEKSLSGHQCVLFLLFFVFFCIICCCLRYIYDFFCLLLVCLQICNFKSCPLMFQWILVVIFYFCKRYKLSKDTVTHTQWQIHLNKVCPSDRRHKLFLSSISFAITIWLTVKDSVKWSNNLTWTLFYYFKKLCFFSL